MDLVLLKLDIVAGADLAVGAIQNELVPVNLIMHYTLA